MRSNKKYKGKYTKKRLENLLRGKMYFNNDFVKTHNFPSYRKAMIAYEWYREGKITFDQFIQWGY